MTKGEIVWYGGMNKAKRLNFFFFLCSEDEEMEGATEYALEFSPTH